MMHATDYFPSNYREARQGFLEASAGAGASLESFENPAPGPDGAPLYTDVAVLGPERAGTVLAILSGTHGVEGFCGSAIQRGLLVEGTVPEVPRDLGIVMVHAVNPYGFAYLRRANEDNVDINRNFVDHSLPHLENPGYDELAGLIVPTGSSALRLRVAFWRLVFRALRQGLPAVKAAVSRAQYTHPRGLFFGGSFETWSNRTVREVVRRHIEGAARVAILDLHTGLGPYGQGEIILDEPSGSPAYRRAAAWWGSRVKSTGESVSVDISGSLKLAVAGMLPHADVTAAVLEFGTVSALKVFKALQAENWLHHNGKGSTSLHGKIKDEMLGAFCPDDEGWKTMVWEQGMEVSLQALAGLSNG